MINGGVEMNTTQKDNYISPDEYEVLQSKYDCKTEYADGEIWVAQALLAVIEFLRHIA